MPQTTAPPTTLLLRLRLLGLASIAALSIFAIVSATASASTVWQVGGQEVYPEEDTWSGKSFTLTDSAWPISCSSMKGSESLVGGGESKGSLTFEGCTMVGTKCKPEPLPLSFTGELVAVGEDVYQKLNAEGNWMIKNCPLLEGIQVEGSIAAKVGPEGVVSTRQFSSEAEEITGASGLHFYGRDWRAAGQAEAVVSGEYAGEPLGVGQPWEPEEADWTVAGEPFFGEEAISLSNSPSVTLENEAEETVQCTSMSGASMKILYGNATRGTLTLHGCSMPENPGCGILGGQITLNARGAIGIYAALDIAMERIQLTGHMTTGGSCPFDGEIGGAVGAWLSPNGATVTKGINSIWTAHAEAPGLLIDGEPWSMTTTEFKTTLSGTNAGKAFGTYP